MIAAARQSGLKGALGTGILALLAFVCCGSAAASDAVEITPEFQAAIERLMEVTKMDQMTEQMTAMMEQQLPAMMEQQIAQLGGTADPEAVATGVALAMEVVRESDADGELMREILVIYAKYFSEDDILQMIAFYESPLGQKTIEVMPRLMQDAMLVSMRWSQSKMPELLERVKAHLKSEGVIE